MTPATFTSSGIERFVYSGENNEPMPRDRLSVQFHYVVSGMTFQGCYAEDFGEGAAIQMERSLKNGPLFVRYNPADPSDYFLDPYRDVRMPS